MSHPAPTTPTPASRSGGGGGVPTSGAVAGSNGPESMTELEREVLDEYGQLLANLNEVLDPRQEKKISSLIEQKLAPLIAELATNPTAQVLDTLRVLERKASLVSTLLKASVYSIVLQQQMLEGDGQEEAPHDQDHGHGGYMEAGDESFGD